MLELGTQAPDFTAALGSGERFTLSEHLGSNVVLFFYPRAFTRGCTAEVGGFCDSYEELIALNAVVLGISTDSIDRQRSFGESLDAPFDLASDKEGQIRRLYDVRRRFGLGTSRVTYVIDTEGLVRGAFHNEVVMGSHVENAMKALQELDPR